MGAPLDGRAPTAIVIGRDQPDFWYGQTGLLLIDGNNNYVFIEDNIEDDMSWILDSKKYVINRKNARRSEDLHYAYVYFDQETVSSKCTKIFLILFLVGKLC